jgi:hypothetical protein
MARPIMLPSQRTAALLLLLAAGCSRGVTPAAPVPARSSATVVPIRIVNNHVHLQMTGPGGKALSLIYDTGAGFTLLDIPVAEALGFKQGSPVSVGGAGNAPVRAYAIEGGRLVLPQDTTYWVTPVIAIGMSLSLFEGIAVNGILGADFTRQAVLQLDYANQRMILHPRSFQYSGNGARIPITFREGHPHAIGQIVLADSTRLTADCVIDVGASGALLLTKPFVERHRVTERVGPTIRRKFGRGVGGSSWATLGRVARLKLGAAEVEAPITAMYGDSAGVLSTDRSFECNVGGEVLRRFVVYLDYGRSQMILEPTAAVKEPFETDMGGAAFRVDSAAGGLRIVDLMPRGPAEVAGLRAEDLIVAVDGRPSLEYGVDALRKRLRRPGGDVELRIRRDQGEQVIRLPVRRLF